MKSLFNRLAAIFTPRTESRQHGASLSNPPEWLERLLLGGYGETTAGVDINEHNALGISTVFACVRAISEDVAKLPLILYRETDGRGKERLRDHPLYPLLRERPNDEMTAFDLRSCITAHALLRGNGYIEIERDGAGRPLALWPLNPDRVEVRRGSDGGIVYVYRDPDLNVTRTIFADDVVHIRGLGSNGLVGYSVVRFARESLGLTAAAERFGGSFFGNSSMPKGVLEHPGVLGEEAQKNLRSSWESVHRGPRNYGRIAILEEGMKFHAVTIPPEDAQFLETRQFQVPEICRWFRMPPHKVADLSRATFSNIEHSSIEYASDTLLPWLVRWEQEIKRKCLLRSEQGLFVEHLTAALLRGDLKSRYDAYAIGRQWGWLSPDDIREFENLNPINGAGGKVYLVPANMLDANKVAAGSLQGGAQEDAIPPDRAFRALIVEAVSRLRRTEADKVSRHYKRADVREWAAAFIADRRSEAASVFSPIVLAYVASFVNRTSGSGVASSDLPGKAGLLSQELGKLHAERLADVFKGDWTAEADARALLWTENITDEVDDVLDRLRSFVGKMAAENHHEKAQQQH